MKGKEDNTLEKFIEEFNKKYGKVFYVPDELPDLKWLPSEVFVIDMITGGGLPLGRVIEVWGKRSCGKSTLFLKWASVAQRTCANCFDYLVFCKCKKQRAMKVLYVDAEGTFSYDYAAKLGVSKDILIGRPDFLEGCWDMCEMSIRQGIDLIIIDTVTSLASKKEIEDSTADKHMAEGARSINQGLRKVLSAMNNAMNEGRRVSVILGNQVRTNLAVMWGSKDFKPGGLGQDFITSIEVKLQVSEMKYDKNDCLLGAVIKAVCLKNKCAKPMLEGEFFLNLSDKLGDTNEIEVVKEYMDRYKVEFDGDINTYEGLIKARRVVLDKVLKLGSYGTSA